VGHRNAARGGDDAGDERQVERFPRLIWIEHPSTDYNVCEQNSCDGQSGDSHAVSPVPNPIYPLPISSAFRDATICAFRQIVGATPTVYAREQRKS
jgi:hypothetical protein